MSPLCASITDQDVLNGCKAVEHAYVRLPLLTSPSEFRPLPARNAVVQAQATH